jgi:hypothetical protein
MLAVGTWLGGLVALGALVAPVIFSRVSMPSSADAMTVVFRRFDLVAMGCAAALLATEAARAIARIPFARIDHVRAGVSVLAAGAAVYEGMAVSPRIAALHGAGVVRGMGSAGMELSRLHDMAELLGKTEVFLLAAVILLHVASWGDRPSAAARAPGAA